MGVGRRPVIKDYAAILGSRPLSSSAYAREEACLRDEMGLNTLRGGNIHRFGVLCHRWALQGGSCPESAREEV